MPEIFSPPEVRSLRISILRVIGLRLKDNQKRSGTSARSIRQSMGRRSHLREALGISNLRVRKSYNSGSQLILTDSRLEARNSPVDIP
jgi:hypothetical protein